MILLDIIAAANTAQPQDYRKLYIHDQAVGLIEKSQRQMLADYGFHLGDYTAHWQWQDASPSLEENSARLAEIARKMQRDGLLEGWRDELYPLARDYQHPPLALLERTAMPVFGGCGYGVHVNGLVRKKDGLYLWLGERAHDKPTDPGKLDQMVAGGQPWGITPFANMQKECAEEAAIPFPLSATAMAVGMGSYCYQVENGIRADVMFLYDLFLPESFIPQNTDGEVAGFQCLPLAEIPTLLCANPEKVKFNSALVMIDCCLRHGVIDAQTPNYQAICHQLHNRQRWLDRL